MVEFVYPPVIATARAAFAALRMRIDERGAEHIPLHGGAVLASNHVSYLDFLFCGLAARPSHRLVRFMAKKSVFDHRVSGPLMRGMRHIPVDREAGSAAYGAAVRALVDGEVVGVFPEATISRSFLLKDFKLGAARMAAEAGVPLVPMVLWGTQRFWTKAKPKQLTRRNNPVLIRVGEPLRPSPSDDPDAVTCELKDRMAGLLHEAQTSYPEPPDDDPWWMPSTLGGTAPTLAEAEALDVAEAAERRARRRKAAGRVA